MEAGVVVAYTYLEAVDGEEAAEDALLEPRAQHDDVVLHVHGARGGQPASPSIARSRKTMEERGREESVDL
jgi:hypothetical protein